MTFYALMDRCDVSKADSLDALLRSIGDTHGWSFGEYSLAEWLDELGQHIPDLDKDALTHEWIATGRDRQICFYDWDDDTSDWFAPVASDELVQFLELYGYTLVWVPGSCIASRAMCSGFRAIAQGFVGEQTIDPDCPALHRTVLDIVRQTGFDAVLAPPPNGGDPILQSIDWLDVDLSDEDRITDVSNFLWEMSDKHVPMTLEPHTLVECALRFGVGFVPVEASGE